jgi:Domain of unknown function (DUF222)
MPGMEQLAPWFITCLMDTVNPFATTGTDFAEERGFPENVIARRDYSAVSWLMHRTGITRGAAVGHTAWAKRVVTHPRVVAALAAGEISESVGRLICLWTGKLPEKFRDESGELLIAAAVAGLGLEELAALFAQMYERARSELPDEDPDRDFDDRSLKLATTFGGAGVVHGDLAPECAELVGRVLDALAAPAGAEDTRTRPCSSSGPRRSGNSGPPIAPGRPRPARPTAPGWTATRRGDRLRCGHGTHRDGRGECRRAGRPGPAVRRTRRPASRRRAGHGLGGARAGGHRQGRGPSVRPWRACEFPAPPAAGGLAGRAEPAAGHRLRRDRPGRHPQCGDAAGRALPVGRVVQPARVGL